MLTKIVENSVSSWAADRRIEKLSDRKEIMQMFDDVELSDVLSDANVEWNVELSDVCCYALV